MPEIEPTYQKTVYPWTISATATNSSCPTFQPRGSPREAGEGSAEGEEVPVRPVRQTAGVQVPAEGARGADAREEVDGHQVHRVRPRLRPQEADGPPQEPRTLPGQVGQRVFFLTLGRVVQ